MLNFGHVVGEPSQSDQGMKLAATTSGAIFNFQRKFLLEQDHKILQFIYDSKTAIHVNLKKTSLMMFVDMNSQVAYESSSQTFDLFYANRLEWTTPGAKVLQGSLSECKEPQLSWEPRGRRWLYAGYLSWGSDVSLLDIGAAERIGWSNTYLQHNSFFFLSIPKYPKKPFKTGIILRTLPKQIIFGYFHSKSLADLEVHCVSVSTRPASPVYPAILGDQYLRWVKYGKPTPEGNQRWRVKLDNPLTNHLQTNDS